MHYCQSGFGAQLFVLLEVAERRDFLDFYVRRGFEEAGEFRRPIKAGVGTPVDPNARLATLHKSSNNAEDYDRQKRRACWQY